MGNLTHAAGRLAVSKVSDVVLKNLDKDRDRKSTRLNSSHMPKSRMPSSA